MIEDLRMPDVFKLSKPPFFTVTAQASDEDPTSDDVYKEAFEKTVIKIFRDGDQWCALSGDDLQSGVAAFDHSSVKAFTKLLKLLGIVET